MHSSSFPTLLSLALVLLRLVGVTSRCGCDLTAFKCDVNCCCDSDCPKLLLAGFNCLPTASGDKSHMCYSQAWVHNAHSRTDLSVLAEDLSGLLCVVVDNNAIEAAVFKNDAVVDASKVDEAKSEQGLISFADMLAVSAPVATDIRGYFAGDPLSIHQAISNATMEVIEDVTPATLTAVGVQETVQDLPLTLPDALGRCSLTTGQKARFLHDIPLASCWLPPTDLRTSCLTTLNPRAVSAWLFSQLQLPQGAKCTNRCKNPEVNASIASSFVIDGQSCSCLGAIKGLFYTFSYTSSSNTVSIEGASLQISIQNVTSPTCSSLPIQIETQLHFVEELGVPPFSRSGNTGYMVGLPLLVATCILYDGTQCLKYNETADRPSTAAVQGIFQDGSCSLMDVASSQLERIATITFGEDQIFGCVLRLNRSELHDVCVTPSPGYMQAVGFADRLKLLQVGRLAGGWTSVATMGKVGTSTGDYLEVTQAARRSEAPTFDDANPSIASTSTCSGVIVGVDLQVLWSAMGDIQDPQARVVAARWSDRVGKLHYTSPDPSVQQAFEFTVTVTYIRYDKGGAAELIVPPRPELPLSLPYDLFYPFLQESRGYSMAAPFLLARLIIAVSLWATSDRGKLA